MEIRGEIYNKRSYYDHHIQKKVNISFDKADELIKVNGEIDTAPRK